MTGINRSHISIGTAKGGNRLTELCNRIFAIFIFVMSLFVSQGFCADKLEFVPMPDWVQLTNVRSLLPRFKQPLNFPLARMHVGEVITNYTLEKHVEVTHLAIEFNELADRYSSRVNQKSQNISYSRSRQKLSIHSINIWRNGAPLKTIDIHYEVDPFRKYASKIGNIDQTGVSLMFPSLKHGDVIELVFSIEGEKSRFGNHISGIIGDVGWNFNSRGVLRRTLIVPENVDLQFDSLPNEDIYQKSVKLGTAKYFWNFIGDQEGGIVNGWGQGENRVGGVYYSDYKSWNELVAQIQSIFLKDQPIHKSIIRKAEKLTKNADSDLEKMERILSFMQAEITVLEGYWNRFRYEKISPEDTLKRKKGTSVEQSMLFIHLLKAVGIEASPALTAQHAYFEAPRRNINPALFNYMAVYLKLDNTEMWLTPDAQKEKGSPIIFDNLKYYHSALIIRDGENDLTRISGCEKNDPE